MAARKAPRATHAPPVPMGRPPFVPTEENREMVLDLVRVGLDQERIAAVLKIDPMTLRKHFRDELDTGMEAGAGKVARNLMKLTETHPLAAIYWLNNRMPHKWRDQRHVKVVEEKRPDLSGLTPAEIALLRRAGRLITPKMIDGSALDVTDEDEE